MPTINKTYLFQEGFNKVWNRVENCKFIPAPYDNEINTWYLFAAKRDGTQEYSVLTNTVLRLGQYIDSLKIENIALTTSDIVKFGEGTETQISTVAETDSVLYSIQGSPAGTVQDSWTASGGTSTTLVDTWAWWTVNEFAGSYVWIKTGAGSGDIQFIMSNTSDTITVLWWSDGVTPDATSTYSVYPYLAEESTLISNSSEVKVYDWTNMVSVDISAFDKAIEWDGRMWYIKSDTKSIISYSVVWQPFAISSFQDTGFWDVLDIAVFWEYLIIWKKNKVMAVKKDLTSGGTTVYSLVNLVSSVWISWKNCMWEYENWLYIMWSDLDLYSVDVIAQNDWTIKWVIKSQWKTLRGYLDRLDADFSFQFFQLKGDLYIIASDENLTYEFVYNSDNKGWLVNTYDFEIVDNKIYTSTLYRITDKTICYKWGEDDLWVKFKQFIGIMFWVDNQFAVHQIQEIKYLIGALKDTYIAVKVNPYSSFNNFNSSYKDFDLAALISKAQPDAALLQWFGGSLFWEQEFWTDEDERVYAEVAVIMDKIGNNPKGNLHEIIMTDKAESSIWFQLGGIFFDYIDQVPAVSLPTMTMAG